MTAKSMTGFGEVSCSNEFGLIVAEIRSSNNRFLDITIKLPDQLKSIEYKIREIVSKYAFRGKIEVRLTLQPLKNGEHSLKLNKQKVDEIIALQNEILLSSGSFEKLGINDILKWPGVIHDGAVFEKINKQELLDIFESASKEFDSFTKREGLQLVKQIKNCASQIESLIKKADKIAPLASDAMLKKISVRLSEAFKETNIEKIIGAEQKEGSNNATQNSSSDLIKAIHERIRLEASMSAMKVDVSEELERIKSHIRELRNVIDNDRVLKGKRLDFLAQELHREANTIGAKAFNQDLSMISLDLRIYIEQIREQVQNLQ
ncbi:DUF1732 domain-containing protein [Betaproteobacteria bacterium]|nr:DUF1732 domain-containing protein [Betaproteobacteria bacterium]